MDEPLNAQDALEAILYQFLSVHDLIEKQRIALAQQNDDLATLTQAFSEQVQQLQQLDTAIRQHIARSLQMATKEVGVQLGEETRNVMATALVQTVAQLNQAADNTYRVLNAVQYQGLFWQRLGLTVACSVLASVVSVSLLMPAPTLPLTPEQITRCQLGNKVDRLMSQLTPKEQQLIWDKLQKKKPGKLKHS